ncbi:hypothetical protein SDC9_203419 [bioreactor metagenome]|uniref:Uncharacterized protein n=1 Tax=bioreactor metagenome TaxID=1076179 RepID=A0A645IWD6_9ZZZZ
MQALKLAWCRHILQPKFFRQVNGTKGQAHRVCHFAVTDEDKLDAAAADIHEQRVADVDGVDGA